ncbi:MAG: HAD hydrolase family protein [Roseibium sp.]|uniref:HAD hydrolase family protein n=1 Tax=Roseibium sp. TaxID=1936156 RepID=UPI0032972672
MQEPTSVIPVCFADLDDTLFCTIEKVPEGMDAVLQATQANNGRHSWMTQVQVDMFNWLNASTTLIPVTARAPDSYDRMTIDFHHGAVLSNGGLIRLPDGSTDPVWAEKIQSISYKYASLLHEMLNFINTTYLPGVLRSWIVKADDLDVYFCVKVNKTETRNESLLNEVLTRLCGRFDLTGATVHRNGNNLSISPPGISKKSAVEYLLSNRDGLKGRPTIGAGDSMTDLPFMRGCHMMMVPGRSQVSEKMKTIQGVK